MNGLININMQENGKTMWKRYRKRRSLAAFERYKRAWNV